MLKKVVVFVIILALPTAWTTPLSLLQPDHPPLAAELGSRVVARASRLMQDAGEDPRLPFPSLQQLAAIKKIAETLVTLGQEVIPSVIGELPMELMVPSTLTTETPNDAVNNK